MATEIDIEEVTKDPNLALPVEYPNLPGVANCLYSNWRDCSGRRFGMAFLTDAERENLAITRMIFHVVGKELEEPRLLDEIEPLQFADFFQDRIKSALGGNLFSFREASTTERVLREIARDHDLFAERSRDLARDFHTRHSGVTSMGVFFVFQLAIGAGDPVFALVKYDNDDVVRYTLNEAGGPQVPILERFRETFVRKTEAMQKIALVRLTGDAGGRLAVRDRSRMSHISDYFQGFLQAQRVNSQQQMITELVGALKETFKAHRNELPDHIQNQGVEHIFATLNQPGHRFGPENRDAIMTAVFGPLERDSPVVRTLEKCLKHRGISEETFEVEPEYVRAPRKRKMVTLEGTEIVYDRERRPTQVDLPDGNKEIRIVTAGILRDDVDDS